MSGAQTHQAVHPRGEDLLQAIIDLDDAQDALHALKSVNMLMCEMAQGVSENELTLSPVGLSALFRMQEVSCEKALRFVEGTLHVMRELKFPKVADSVGPR